MVRRGAKPVFVDVDLNDFNILPQAIEKAITPRTKAIIPVHLFGQMAEMNEILKIAKTRGIAVIEDSAQGIGAEYHGKRAGSMGRFGAFSFFPTKNLGAFGDGGALTVQTSEDDSIIKMLRMHGSRVRYHHEAIGGCFRLDALQALILEIKLKSLEKWQEQRRKNAAFYDHHLAGVGDIIIPRVNPNHRHVYHQYVIRTEKREALRNDLTAQGIGSEVYYPVPIPHQGSMQFLKHQRGDYPHSEKLSETVLALPIYPELSEADLQTVVLGIKKFFNAG